MNDLISKARKGVYDVDTYLKKPYKPSLVSVVGHNATTVQTISRMREYEAVLLKYDEDLKEYEKRKTDLAKHKKEVTDLFRKDFIAEYNIPENKADLYLDLLDKVKEQADNLPHALLDFEDYLLIVEKIVK